MKAVYISVIAGCLGAMAGCASGVAGRAAWVRAHGGIVAGGRQARAEGALAKLGEAGKGECVCVLECGGVCAYGWPDGRLFVTRGLVDLLDDRELAAALAHELGHLLDDGHLHGLVSLRGCQSGGDAEARADAIGARLLDEAGVGAGAMVGMLEKVEAAPGVRPGCREAVERRIGLLRGEGGG